MNYHLKKKAPAPKVLRCVKNLIVATETLKSKISDVETIRVYIACGI